MKAIKPIIAGYDVLTGYTQGGCSVRGVASY